MVKVETYGMEIPGMDGSVKQGTVELWCYGHGGPLGRYGHMHNAIECIWNEHEEGSFIWNEWSEWMVREFCEGAWVVVSGPAASWKTTSAAIYSLGAWYSLPDETVVICTSTTLDGLRRRIWKEITKYWRKRPAVGHMVQSRNCIQWERGSDAAGIFGLATDKGEIEKAIGKIIGFHAKNIVVVSL